jgi:Ion transport protein
MLKVFEQFEATKNLRVLFDTFIVTLPAMGSIGGLLALLIYIYAILGVTIFAEIKQIAPLDDV